MKYLLRMPQELHTKVKIASFSTGKTMLQFILEAIQEKLQKEEV